MGRRIAPYLWNPLFWGIVLLAIITNYFQNQTNGLWFSYGMDILALPIYLYIAQVILKIYYKHTRYEIPLKDKWIIWGIVCVIFELILPYLSTKYTADWADCFAYFIGFIVIFPFINTLPNFLAGSRV